MPKIPNNQNGLGSRVLPLEDGSKPPTTEIGSPLLNAMGYLPLWSVLEAVDELETNAKLTFPESVSTYHNMRTDPQIQGLLTGATWPLLRMLWYIDQNGAPTEMVEHYSAHYNLPIAD